MYKSVEEIILERQQKNLEKKILHLVLHLVSSSVGIYLVNYIKIEKKIGDE